MVATEYAIEILSSKIFCMNSILSSDSALARHRARRVAIQRAARAAMTPIQRALSLQRRRDQYRSRRDAAVASSSAVISSSAPRLHSVSSLGATSLVAPSVFVSTSDRLQLLSPSGIQDVVTVLQSHVDREVLRMFGSSFHCHLQTDNSQLGFDIGPIRFLFFFPIYFFLLCFICFVFILYIFLLRCPAPNQPDSDNDQLSDDDGDLR